jgi:alkylation response protein AidB-like acyl-CoA dehydrogenase
MAGSMVLTFYVGEAAAAFRQYAAYVQRRTATHIVQFATALAH